MCLGLDNDSDVCKLGFGTKSIQVMCTSYSDE